MWAEPYAFRHGEKIISTEGKLFTLPHYIEFLKSRDPAERYNYLIADQCLNAQYMRWAFPNGNVETSGSAFAYKVHGRSYDVPKLYNQIAQGNIGSLFNLVKTIFKGSQIWTFGAALQRAEKQMEKTQCR
jgi:hypothetical protein